MKWLIGVDEAGRGPLAGPVTVGVAAIAVDFDWTLLPGVGDSKKLTEKKRVTVFSEAMILRKKGLINFAVCQSNAAFIDDQGIVKAVQSAMDQAFNQLEIDPNDCEVRLDGALRAPSLYQNQITIIGGDGKEPVIGLASILAKVTRDRHMEKLAKQSSLLPYMLDVHKGYGTKKHRELIKKFGLSDIHRRTFCRNVLS